MEISEDSDQRRFILRFKSYSEQRLCISYARWPIAGAFPDASRYVYVQIGDQKYYSLRENVSDYCPGCRHVVAPGTDLVGYVDFLEFPPEAFVNTDKERKLIVPAKPYRCG